MSATLATIQSHPSRHTYKTYLLDLEASLSSFANRCPHGPFKQEIEKWRQRVGFERWRTPERDYAAVRREVDQMACTPEEIQEHVPLSLVELVAICDRLIAEEPMVYERRQVDHVVGVTRGEQVFGIFRRDAPYLDGTIIAQTQSHYEDEG